MYVAIEGIDTSGKSTQLELLKQKYPDAFFTKEPGGTPLGEKLRDMLLHSTIDSPVAEMFLFLADRAELTHKLQRLPDSQPVFSDRSLISGMAYARGFDIKQLMELNRLATNNFFPEKVILLWLEKSEFEKRLSQKTRDRIEEQGIDSILAIQNRMKETLEFINIDHLILDAGTGRDELHSKIVDYIKSQKGA